MLKHLTGFLLPAVVPLLIHSQPIAPMQQLKQRILDTLSGQKGEFAVAFKDLTSGKTLFIHEHESFHAASTMKTPVMIEVYKQAAKKKFSLSDSVTLKNEFKSIADGSTYSLDTTDDSEYETYKLIGKKITIRDLVYKMITVSSNFATNTLVGLVDAKNVTKTMRSLGANDIQVLRGVEDQKAFDNGLNNTTTAYDLMLVFEKIATGKIVNKTACDAMIKILLDQKFNDIIPARLPATVKVAHKTGWLTGVEHDSGIVYLPDGRKYILVILSQKLEDQDAAKKAMIAISEMIYKYLNPA
ncbi:MAG: serine hydrolase [Bacteroidota bacterium]